MKLYVATIEITVYANSDEEAAKKAIRETALMHTQKGNNANLQCVERTGNKWYQSRFVNIAKVSTKK